MTIKLNKTSLIIIAITVLIGLAVITLFLLPTEWQVKKSISIATDVEHIHPFINDLQNWPKWAKKPNADPSIKYDFQGPKMGKDAIMEWRGISDRGKLQIIDTKPKKGVWYQLTDLNTNTVAEASLTYLPQKEDTTVVWEINSRVGPFRGVTLPFIKNKTSDYFDYAFLQLKYLVESTTLVEWHVKQSIIIQSTIEEIYPMINNLKEWDKWTQMSTLYPFIKYTVEEPSQGQGAKMNWRGAQTWGHMKITKSDPKIGIEYEMAYHSNEININGSIRYVSKGNETTVTWKATGFLPAAHSKIVGAIEKSNREYYDFSLHNLKRILETPPGEAPKGSPPGAVPPKPPVMPPGPSNAPIPPPAPAVQKSTTEAKK